MSQSDTKQRLINSAIKIFSEKGFFNTKVSDIVKDAGVAQGTFYIYFKSKEDIFIYIIETITAQIENIIKENKSLNLPIDKKIEKFSTELFSLLYKYKNIGRIFFFQLLCIDEKFKNIFLQTNKKISQFYLELFKEYKDKELITDLFMGFGKRLFEFSILIEDKPLEEILTEYKKGIKVILGGLK